MLTLGVVLAAASAARLLGSRRPEARLTRSIVAAKSAGVDEVLIASAEALRAEVIEEGQWLSLVGDPAEVSVGHALGTARLVGMAESLNKARRVAEMEVALAAAEREAAALELEVAQAVAKRQSAAERQARSAEEARRARESTLAEVAAAAAEKEAAAAVTEEEAAAEEEEAEAEALTRDAPPREQTLLAIDLGLKSGAALYDGRGALLRYTSFQLQSAAELRAEATQMLRGSSSLLEGEGRAVTHLVIEGGDIELRRQWQEAVEQEVAARSQQIAGDGGRLQQAAAQKVATSSVVDAAEAAEAAEAAGEAAGGGLGGVGRGGDVDELRVMVVGLQP